ncbi:putative acetyltransferase [mine drainage metagenome]|uniref:Putative acetyltransferase n=1 Tax=mine drainage metagenome TaxID=410659 RepID=A0A1J5T2P4_9ZZZZ
MPIKRHKNARRQSEGATLVEEQESLETAAMATTPRITLRTATPKDLRQILTFIKDLAAYERLSHQVTASPAVVRAALFPRNGRPAAECLLAFVDADAAGFAVFYPNFSTFVGRPGLFLEDLFVRPDYRRMGVGRALWTAVARTAAKRKCRRMDWLVLSWNKKAQRFYRSLGARHHPTWTLCRIEGERLAGYARTKAPARTAHPAVTPRTRNAPLKKGTP